jgi:sugar/nucleoside kinase (ribokinase family)
MALICVGSMAYDAIETPFGKRDKIVGGAAVYAAYAAANFIKPINLVSIIGNDFEESEIKSLEAKDCSFEGVERVKDKK